MENNQLNAIVGHKELPTILIVDDDPDIIEFINQTLRIFKEDRFNVVFATTGEGAISMINIQLIDAVVMDMKLPDITGINIGKQIKEHDPTMPIAIFTSYSGDNVEEQVREIDAAYWYKLDKMSNPEILLSSLYELVMHISKGIYNSKIISESEIENMKQRRKSRIEKLTYPSFLISTRTKF